jgi:hypothetical protein
MSVQRIGSWGGGTYVAFCDSPPPSTVEHEGRTYHLYATMKKKDWDGVYKGIYR